MISGPAASLRAVWHLSAGACWGIYVYRSGRLTLERLRGFRLLCLLQLPLSCPSRGELGTGSQGWTSGCSHQPLRAGIVLQTVAPPCCSHLLSMEKEDFPLSRSRAGEKNPYLLICKERSLQPRTQLMSSMQERANKTPGSWNLSNQTFPGCPSSREVGKGSEGRGGSTVPDGH